MFSPPMGMSNSGTTMWARSGSIETEAELSTVSAMVFIAIQQPEKRDISQPIRP
jgi:hypothetical protein